jgi:hypothetical protein
MESGDIRISMTISHTEPAIKIKRKLFIDAEEYDQELIFYSDNRGEKNSLGLTLGEKMESKTNWDKDKLVTRGLIKGEMKLVFDTNAIGGNLQIRNKYTQPVVEEWELSPDGKTLTNVTTRSAMKLSEGKWAGPGKMEVQTKKVYVRVT